MSRLSTLLITFSLLLGGSGCRAKVAVNSISRAKPAKIPDQGIPTILSIVGTNGSYRQGATVDIDVNFSETITGTASTLILTGARTAVYLSTPDAYTIRYRYTVQAGDDATDITVTAFNISTDTIKDATLDNVNTALPIAQNLSDTSDVTLDTTAPTLTITSNRDPSPTNNSAITLTIQFSETVTGFDTTDVTATNATKGTFTAVDGDTYTLALTANAAILTADVASAKAQDAATNNNTAAIQWSIGYDDGTVPTITSITGNSGSYKQAATVDIDVNFSETVTLSGMASTLTLTGARTATYQSKLDADTIRYRYTVQAGDNAADINVTAVNINTDTIKDSTNNNADLSLPAMQNLAGTSNVNLDNTAPTAVISSTSPTGTNVTPIPMTVTFNESVTGFSSAGVTIAGATINNFAGSGTIYTFDAAPTAQSITVTVDAGAGVASDAAENVNTAATQLVRVFDNTNLTVTISTSASSPTGTRPTPLTFTFNKTAYNFVVTDITVTNGSAGNFAGSGTTYTADITPTNADPTDANITIDVAQGLANDAAGNTNLNASDLVVGYDTVAPVPGSTGTVTTASVADTTLTLNWTKATDTSSAQSALIYEVRRSSSNNMTTVALAESNGFVAKTYTTDIATAAITGLTVGNTYYFTVIAKDVAGSKAVYSTTSATTFSPLIAGNSGAQGLSWNGSAMTINWNVATGGTLPQSSLQYKVVRSTSANIDTVANAGTNGTLIQDWTTNISSAVATGLSAGTTHYFNVLVKDTTSNMTAYTQASRVTEFSSPLMTSTSPERKTFFDSSSNKHWAFWYSGQDVRYGNSADGTSFTTSAAMSAITTPRFSLSAKAGYVFIAYESGDDVMVRRGSISGISITWDTALTALDGSSSTNAFVRPSVAIGNDDLVYVAAYHLNSGTYTPKAVVSTTTYSGSMTLGSSATVGASASTITALTIVPQGSHAMLLTSDSGNAIKSYTYNGSTWTAVTGGVSDWDRFGWVDGLNAAVKEMAVFSGELYIGGDFTSAGGLPLSYIARWSGSGWSPVGSGVNGPVNALAASDSALYVGGSFTTAGGSAAARIAKWDGSTWSALGAGVDDAVDALAVQGSDLYVGGSFQNAGGNAASAIAKWDGANWSSLGSGVEDMSTGSVSALLISGTNLYVGGRFDTAGGVDNRNNIARWTLGATVDSGWSGLGSGVQSTVYALASTASSLYVGGSFTTAGGVAGRNNIARWDMTQSTDTGWSGLGLGTNGTVFALALSGLDLYVGGGFTTAGGVAGRNSAAKWDTTKSDNTGWSGLSSGIESQSVYSILMFGPDVLYGGSFYTPAMSIAKWNGSAWSGFNSGFDGYIYAVTLMGGDVYVGGNFKNIGSLNVNGIARWNGSSWSALSTGVSGYLGPSTGTVYALAVIGTNLYAAGGFTTAGGVSASGVAKWNGSAWSALGSGIPYDVRAFAVNGTDLYVGGGFTTAGGVAGRNRIAKWDSTKSDNTGWSSVGTGTNNLIYALAHDGTYLYAGGTFDKANGTSTTVNAIAKWNGTTWSPLNSGLWGDVQALHISGGNLYAGGYFPKACAEAACSSAGTPVSNIARWNGTSWFAVGTATFNQGVGAIAVFDGNIYVGGAFTDIGGVAVNGTAVWNGSTWGPIGSDSLGVTNTFLSGSALIAGGRFGVSSLSSTLLAKASRISAASDSSGVHLAYVNESDNKPYVMTFDNLSWGTASNLSSNIVTGQIVIGASSDGAQRIVAWDRGGTIEYKPYASGAWGSVGTLGSSTNNHFPTIPHDIDSGTWPVVWTKGSNESYTVVGATTTF